MLQLRNEKELHRYGLMVDPDEPDNAIPIRDASTTPAANVMAKNVSMSRKSLEEFLVETLGDGEYSLQVATPGPPTLVMVRDYGWDDAGERAWDVEVIDPASENNMPLQYVAEHVAWLHGVKLPTSVTTRTVEEIEREIVRLDRRLNLREQLEIIERIGELLLELKSRVPHGQWTEHLQQFGKRHGIGKRTLQVYTQVAKAKAQRAALLPDHVSLREFQRALKESKRAAKAQERREAREAVMASAAPDKRYKIVNADCRIFEWPDDIDHIGSDPPWDDLEAYRWLADFAMNKLKAGGSLLVQCDTEKIATVSQIIKEAGLSYITALAITFDETFPLRHHPLNLGWRPVLLFAKGRWKYQGLARRLDRHQAERDYKSLHEWQQPQRPWEYWLSGLTRAGELIADPFACTGTIGAALKAAGGRYYLGTEINAENALVGQGRLAEQPEGIRTVVS